MLSSGHLTPVTTVNDGRLDEIAEMPAESHWPILLALTVTLAFASALTSHYVVAGLVLITSALVLVGWHGDEPEEA